jgi:hypothetical protein
MPGVWLLSASRRLIVAWILALSPIPVIAQQNTLRVISLTQLVPVNESGRGGQQAHESDLHVDLRHATPQSGLFRLDAQVVKHLHGLCVGHAGLIWDDVRLADLRWSFSGGDSFLTPVVTRYGFSDLFAPAIPFRGVAVVASSARRSLEVNVGRVTALRNVFGSDPETLGQSVIAGQVRQAFGPRFELIVHGSRIRTSDLGEFAYELDASEAAAITGRYRVIPSMEVLVDGGMSRYRRGGLRSFERDASLLLGTGWTVARGWLQVNAHRFSAGHLSLLNYPLNDRTGTFAAGEFDLVPQVRIFGGVENFRVNLHPERARQALHSTPPGTSRHGYGGVRVNVRARSALSVRTEAGGRSFRQIRPDTLFETGTGVIITEWHSGFSAHDAYVRYERRSNADLRPARERSIQHDAHAQMFLAVSGQSRLHASLGHVRRVQPDRSEERSIRFGVGATFSSMRRGYNGSLEALLSHTTEMANNLARPTQVLTAGFSTPLGRQTTVGADLLLDRAMLPEGDGSPVSLRALVRFSREFQWGTVSPESRRAVASQASR